MIMNLFIALCFSLVAATASAQELAPDVEMTKMTNEVIEIIKRNQDINPGNQKKVNELIEAKVLPHFDFGSMTALAMGLNWPKASGEQRRALTNEFRSLLVRSYISALSIYRNQAIDFKPLRAAAGEAKVTVRTQLKQPGSEPINIDYSMEKSSRGWMVHEIVVGGISLVANYRESFEAEIRGAGVDGLIKTLVSKNRSQEPQIDSKPK
jgi:phospholipid transport system substrate-binding protein